VGLTEHYLEKLSKSEFGDHASTSAASYRYPFICNKKLELTAAGSPANNLDVI
jgi:hypothetical protein